LDNFTHGLLGYGIYALMKRKEMDHQKKWYAAAAILGAEIADVDAWTFTNLDAYLRIHRGLTHSALFTPVMALSAAGILFALKRDRKALSWKWIYGLSFFGGITHWLFDWFNTWGTGLLEPFVHARYSLGFLPIVDPLLFLIFGLGFFMRKKLGTKKAFLQICGLIFLYLVSQASQNLWIKHKVSPNYDQTVVAAGFIPGEFTVIGKRGSTFEIYRKSLFSEGEKTKIQSDTNPLLVQKVLSRPEARTIAWFSPFYAITLEPNGKYAMIYDPRFYRNGDSFIKAVIDLAGD
jgi:inner membrane protein